MLCNNLIDVIKLLKVIYRRWNKDRIEIINPGNLPNNLTIENIKGGNSNVKNPVLASFAYHVLPYRGIGSGIMRALKEYPDIEFINDLANSCFKCVIKRKAIG